MAKQWGKERNGVTLYGDSATPSSDQWDVLRLPPEGYLPRPPRTGTVEAMLICPLFDDLDAAKIWVEIEAANRGI